MSEGVSKLRKGGAALADPTGGITKLDKKLSKKGAFAEDQRIKAKKEAKESQDKQTQAIGEQQIAEQLRTREAESDVARRKLLRKTGGRQSLIASR